jgi:hypothetical protein
VSGHVIPPGAVSCADVSVCSVGARAAPQRRLRTTTDSFRGAGDSGVPGERTGAGPAHRWSEHRGCGRSRRHQALRWPLQREPAPCGQARSCGTGAVVCSSQRERRPRPRSTWRVRPPRRLEVTVLARRTTRSPAGVRRAAPPSP